jgi:hypothetical protein
LTFFVRMSDFLLTFLSVLKTDETGVSNFIKKKLNS